MATDEEEEAVVVDGELLDQQTWWIQMIDGLELNEHVTLDGVPVLDHLLVMPLAIEADGEDLDRKTCFFYYFTKMVLCTRT